MNASPSTIDSPVGPVPAVTSCPHCGRPLKRTSVVANGRTYSGLPCWGSCGCPESHRATTSFPCGGRRYRRAGIGRRFEAAEADLGDYPRKVVSGRSLYVFGGYGTGKTHFASALAKAIMDMPKGRNGRYSVRLANARDVMTEIQGTYDGNRTDVLERLYGCDVLVLDDLGKEQSTEYAISMLYEIVDARYREGKPIVVTSNFSRGELLERWARKDPATAEAIVSRLCDGAEVLRMDGADRRMAGGR